jgi:HAD superfamily hydrolase (TIGR01509 family)
MAVVFDLGKVLVDFDYNIAATRIAAASKLSPPEVQEFLDHSPLLYRYETGLLNKQQFHGEICQRTGFTGDLEEFSRIFADIFSPMDEMIALHARLRKQGIPTFIFSNTNDIAIDQIRTHFPFFHEFDDYILSYEHGAMKPNPKLYEVVEKVSGRSGAQLVYLDDRLENVEAGIARGWHGIHHQDPPRSIAALRKHQLLDWEPL